MSEPAIASTQYDDFRGTIAIDGFDGLSVYDLLQSCKIPKGYWPVGVKIYGFGRGGGKSEPMKLQAKVLCVHEEEVGGLGPDHIVDYCKSNDTLTTVSFDAEIDLIQLASKLKRLDVILLSKIVRDVEVHCAAD